jgi:hypothetical protein
MKRPSRRRSAGKAGAAQDVATLEDIPNVGPAVAADLRRLGLTAPADLLGRDPYALYEDLATCGSLKKPWWKYTAERKRRLAARTLPADSD